jgi:hypothetical protein
MIEHHYGALIDGAQAGIVEHASATGKIVDQLSFMQQLGVMPTPS